MPSSILSASWSGRRQKLNLIFKKVCEKAKRFYEVTTFFQYAMADGMHRLLFGPRRRLLRKSA